MKTKQLLLQASLMIAITASAMHWVPQWAAASDEEEAATEATVQTPTAVNIAPQATPAAHYTAAWNNLYAINNGTVGYGKLGTPTLGDGETWGSWVETRPAEGWLTYTWLTPRQMDRCVVYYWADNNDEVKGSGVTLPASWRIQYWGDDEEWHDVTLAEGEEYTRHYDAPNEVTFEPVTSTSLRLLMQASGNEAKHAALGVTEWEVYSVPQPYSFAAAEWTMGDGNRVSSVTVNDDNSVTVNGKSGNHNICLKLSTRANNHYYLMPDQHYLVVRGSGISAVASDHYLWWLIGKNASSNELPSAAVALGDEQVAVAWDATKTRFASYWPTEQFNLSANGAQFNTIFGITATTDDGSATLTDISFYSAAQINELYPELAQELRLSEISDAQRRTYAEMWASWDAIAASAADASSYNAVAAQAKEQMAGHVSEAEADAINAEVWYALHALMADMESVSYSVNIENSQAHAFLTEADYSSTDVASVIASYMDETQRCDHPASVYVPLPQGSGEWTVTYSSSADYADAAVITTQQGATGVEVKNTVPGVTYYYKVEAEGETAAQGQFTPAGALRMIKTATGNNIRDLGGWTTEGGRTLAYGKLYRGGEVNVGHVMAQEDKDELLRLGIGAEIDLRSIDQTGGNDMSVSPLGSDVSFLFFDQVDYDMPSLVFYAQKYNTAFTFLLDQLRQDKAVYFHCIWGADRTGQLAMLLEGLCGVTADQLCKDYELTSFSNAGLRNKDNISTKLDYIRSLTGTTLQQNFYDYWNSVVGISEEQIDEFISLMGGDPCQAPEKEEEAEEGTQINVAPQATPAAHYTAAWNNLYAINNGTLGYSVNDTGNGECWASWSDNRPANGWLTYTWAEEHEFSRCVIYFWWDNDTDNWGNNVAVPREWKIQYWNGEEWQDVTLVEGESYTRNRMVPNKVSFEAVKTTQLRLWMEASTDGKTYAALGVTEWEAYANIYEPHISVDSDKAILLSRKAGYQTATIGYETANLPAEGLSVTVEGVQGVTAEQTESSITLSLNDEATATGLGALVLAAGETRVEVPVMVSVDEGFEEKAGNLIYDPCFYSLYRMGTWNVAPQIVSLADGVDVKCGATCVKYDMPSGTKSGLEAGNIYLAAGTYHFTGWIKSNGTMDAGIWSGNTTGFSSEQAASTDGHIINFIIPSSEGEWQEFDFVFTISDDRHCNAWINNDRGRTATEAYLDNWQIYSEDFPETSGEIVEGRDYDITPVVFTDVKLTDQFWAPRMAQNQTATIPLAIDQCYSTGRVDNFLKAAAILRGENIGYFATELTFDDTDIYKVLEGMSYSIQTNYSAEMEAQMDELIRIVGEAQEPDGYLYTPRTAGRPGNYHSWVGAQRWEKDPDLSHELYNCGHLYEAAYAHYNATGKTSLLDIATKSADLLVKDFLEGGLTYEPGHQIVEMGLVKLYRVTGKKEYLALAKYFLDLRGNKGTLVQEYSQTHKPVVLQDEAVGHAVRAAYMYSGMADVAALTGNAAYLDATDRIWENVVGKKMYLTGGIGAIHNQEKFGANYELPNKTGYCETCAAIANVYWNWRQFLLHGEAKYYDVLERTLYNGVISGIGLDGKSFFYPNPLESDGVWGFNNGGHTTRQPWFGCACCPSNLCRFLASVPGYVYAHSGDSLYVNLYMQSNSEIAMQGGKVTLTQATDYPWSGDVTLSVKPEQAGEFAIMLRIPGWAKGQPVPSDLYTYADQQASAPTAIAVNGEQMEYTIGADGYVEIRRQWQEGDQVTVSFPMDVHRVHAHEEVKDDAGRVALERGPIVYCLEQPDNEVDVLSAAITEESEIALIPDYEVVEGARVVALDIKGSMTGIDEPAEARLVAIPYYAWCNRGAARMSVWVNEEALAYPAYEFYADEWVVGDSNRANQVEADTDDNTITVYGNAGNHNICVQFDKRLDSYYALSPEQHYLVVRGSDLSTELDKSNLWWLNGYNHGSSELPVAAIVDEEGQTLVAWDITATRFAADWGTSIFPFTSRGAMCNTIFGLTSTAEDWSAELTDISFYTDQQIVDTYPELGKALDIDLLPTTIRRPVAQPEGTIYTLGGVRVRHAMHPGVYIVNGKKVVK